MGILRFTYNRRRQCSGEEGREVKDVDFSVLVGVTLLEVNVSQGNDEIEFVADDGRKWRMFHSQDCCESVSIDDIAGDVVDLVGSPITMAEEVSNDKWPEGKERPSYCESYTWTFYKLATIKGYVTIRWFGESNGYYSESVDFVESSTPVGKE